MGLTSAGAPRSGGWNRLTVTTGLGSWLWRKARAVVVPVRAVRRVERVRRVVLGSMVGCLVVVGGLWVVFGI